MRWGLAVIGSVALLCSCGDSVIEGPGQPGGSTTTGAGTATGTGTATGSVTNSNTGGVGGAGANGGGGSVPDCPPPTEVEQLADVEEFTGALALGGSDVVWLMPGMAAVLSPKGVVRTVPKCGGTTITIASDQAFPWDLAVQDGVAYWTNMGTNTTGSVEDGSVMRAPIYGSAVTLANDDCSPRGLALDDTRVFWTCCGICSMPLAGGNLGPVLQGGGTSIAVDDTHAYWVDHSGVLMRQPKTGGPVSSVAQDGCPSHTEGALAVDSTHAYWWDGCEMIVKAPKDGGSVTVLATASDPAMGVGGRIALDATNVYWVGPEFVWAVDKQGGAQVAVAPSGETGLGYTGGIAADASAVYWNAHGHIWRAPKP